MAKHSRGARYMDEVMAEPIRMPGCPQLIVTRGWAYQWLARMGYDTKAKGFASVDYMVFGGTRINPVNEPLTDLSLRWAKNVIRLMESHCR